MEFTISNVKDLIWSRQWFVVSRDTIVSLNHPSPSTRFELGSGWLQLHFKIYWLQRHNYSNSYWVTTWGTGGHSSQSRLSKNRNFSACIPLIATSYSFFHHPDPVFSTRPAVFSTRSRFFHQICVFHQTPCFPPDPLFSTRPRVFYLADLTDLR